MQRNSLWALRISLEPLVPFFSREESLRGEHFHDDDEVSIEVEDFLESQIGDFYNQGIRQFINR